MARLLPLEQPLGVSREFENLDALGHVGFISGLMPVDFALAAILLLAPLVRHFIEERRVYDAVEFVDVHRVNTILKSFVLGLIPLDRFLVLAPFVGVAGVQRITHPFQHLVVELQSAKQFGELLLQQLLADIDPAARDRVTLAFIGVTGAVVIDITLFLDLADHRAAAFRTRNQTREGEVMRHAALLLGVTAIEDALHTLPQFARDQWLVLTRVNSTIPLELARVDVIA